MLKQSAIIKSIQDNKLINDLLENNNTILEQLDLSTTVNLNFESKILNLEQVKAVSTSAEKIIFNDYLEKEEQVNDFDLLQEKNGWLNLNLDSHLEFEDVSVFRCCCPACNGESITKNFELKSLSSSLNSTTTTTSNSLSQGIIDTLLTPYKWTNKTITYSFYENDIFKGAYYGSETGVKEVSDKIKQNVRTILQAVERFVGLDFVEVAETNTSTFGQIRYMLSNNPGYAYAYLPFGSSNLAGDVHLSSSYDNATDTNGFQNDPGKHGYVTLIHETFHALGLEHPQESGDGDVLNANQDNLSTTVMTYDFKGNSPGTAMPYDIAALQQIYGAANYNIGNDTYVFGTTTDVFTVNGQFAVLPNNRLKQTIWDSNGVDTLDFSKLSFQSGGYLFDLNQGGWLVANAQNITTSTGEKYYNYGTSLAYGVTIENIIGSSSNDTIVANNVANRVSGYVKGTFAGNDTLIGTNQLDTLDLSSYKESEITRTQNGNNLLVNLGSGGSITVKDYYAIPEANRLNISLSTVAPVVSSIAIAEVGRITNVNQNLQTITLKNNYINPVVFAQPLSYKASDPSVVRIANIDAANDTLSFYLEEAEYRDDIHVNESFSYMVVEAGTWKLENGTLLEVGTLNTNKVSTSGWENLSFKHNFISTPVVLSQVQSDNDTQFVRTRQRNATVDGFSITLEEEEALMKSGHGTESIGWLAISSSSGKWDGLSYQAKNTGNAVNHNWYNINATTYKTTPNLLASIASYNEQDPVGLRYQEITGTTGSTIQIKIEEDKSFDTELRHAKEQVNLFAIEGSGILKAQAYDPLVNSIMEHSLLEDSLAITNDDVI
jgi:Peptidase M10 serralysin C terminal